MKRLIRSAPHAKIEHFSSNDVRPRRLSSLILNSSFRRSVQQEPHVLQRRVRPTILCVPQDQAIQRLKFAPLSCYFSSEVDTDLEEVDDDNAASSGGNDQLTSTDEKRLIYREILYNWYKVNFDVKLDDAYEVTLMPPEDGETTQIPPMWTAAFVCPITKHRLKAKGLPGHEGFRYFQSKKLACQAAAREAAKFFCPFDDGEDDIILMSNDLRKQLQTVYMKTHGTALTDDMFPAIMTSRAGKHHGGNWWTASFVCPITGTTFPSLNLPSVDTVWQNEGKYWYRRKTEAIQAACLQAFLKATPDGEIISLEEHEMYEQKPSIEPLRKWYLLYHSMELDDDCFVVTQTSWKGSGGVAWTGCFVCPVYAKRYDAGALRLEAPFLSDGAINWYKKKSHALAATALRAYDSVRWETTGEKEPRFCLEDPSSEQHAQLEGGEASEAVAHEVSCKPSNPGDENFQEEHVDDIDDISEPEEEGSLDDDDFVIEYVPHRKITSLDLVGVPKSVSFGEAQKVASTEFYSTETHLQTRSNAISQTHRWLASQSIITAEISEERSVFDSAGISNTLLVAKGLLQTLAHANYISEQSSELSGQLEGAANSILDFLRDSSVSKPDAECYALYIQCIENSFTAVKKGERIYDAMTTGGSYDGHQMPPFHISVFNNLVRRRSQLGQRTDLTELRGLPVNRETFLFCLSGSGYNDFDSQYFLDCIGLMKEIANKTCDDTLQVDIEMYNAPLRCGNGKTSGDDLSKAFGNSATAKEQEEKFRLATDIDNWFQSICAGAFGSAIRPNLESYENVLQAWVRTGTAEGLNKAEMILESLIRDTDYLKMKAQVFEYFLAAAGYSGNSEKVDRWVSRMRELWLDQGCEASFNVHRLNLLRLLSRVVGASHGSTDGSECLSILQEQVQEAKGGNILLDARAFLLTLEALRRSDGSRFGSLDVASGVQEVLVLFDGLLLQSLEEAGCQSPEQQRLLLRQAPSVYCAALTVLRDLKSAEGNSQLLCHLDWLEKIIRRSGEHSILLEQDHKTKKTEIDDLPSLYPFDKFLPIDTKKSSWEDFHNTLIDAVSRNSTRDRELSNQILCILAISSTISQRGNIGKRSQDTPLLSTLNSLHVTDPLLAQYWTEFEGSSSINVDEIPVTNEQKRKVSARRKHEEKKPNRRPRRPLAKGTAKRRVGM